MIDLKPCPFCGGKAKISFADYRFAGRMRNGDKKKSYRVQFICTRCKSRGKPIITKQLINPNPYMTIYWNPKNTASKCILQTEMFDLYVIEAAEAWNKRKNNDSIKSF